MPSPSRGSCWLQTPWTISSILGVLLPTLWHSVTLTLGHPQTSLLGSVPPSAGLADSARLSHMYSTSQPHMEPLCPEPLSPPALLSQWAASPPTSHPPSPSFPSPALSGPCTTISPSLLSLSPTDITLTPLASPGLPASSHCPEFIKTMESGPSLWMRENVLGPENPGHANLVTLPLTHSALEELRGSIGVLEGFCLGRLTPLLLPRPAAEGSSCSAPHGPPPLSGGSWSPQPCPARPAPSLLE